MGLYNQPVPLAPHPKAGFSATRETDSLRALADTRRVLSKLVTELAPYFPGLDITDVEGNVSHALAFPKGTGPLPGPQLHNVSGLAAGLTDPFDIAQDVLTAVLGSITLPDPTTFVSTLSGLFTTALGTVGGAGSPPSRATVKALVDGYLSAFTGLVGDVSAATAAELSSRLTGVESAIEAYFSAEGALSPRNGDYLYNESTGIVYVIFRQQGGIPSSNSIFRVPFSVGDVTWVALTTFPAPDIAGLVSSIAGMVMGIANSLVSLLANLLTDTLMALFGLISAIWQLIDDFLAGVWSEIGILQGLIDAIEEILDTLETVTILKADGYTATVGVLGNSLGVNKKARIDFIRSDTGYGAEANVIVIDGYNTPIADQVDWVEIDYLSQTGGHRKVKVITRTADGYPKTEDASGNLFTPETRTICSESGTPETKQLLLADS